MALAMGHHADLIYAYLQVCFKWNGEFKIIVKIEYLFTLL